MQGKKVLIVDDEATSRKMVEVALESLEYDLLFAADGKAALKAARDHLPDLILMDVELPGMNGYEAARRIRQQELTRDIPIVIITSRAGVRHQEKATSLGANDYLVKPYHEQELVDRVERSLAARGFRRPGG